jgi:hypothetical protein
MAAPAEATLGIIEEDEIECREIDGQDKCASKDNEVFEFDKTIEDVSVTCARAGSIGSIGSIGSFWAESSFPLGRGGRRRSAKVSVCSNVSMRTVSEGTPPYISIMSRHDSVAPEMTAPVPDQAWVGLNSRFMKGEKGRTRNYNTRKKDIQGDMFAGYQKTVQDRIKDASVNLDLNFIECCEYQVGS